MSRPDQKRGQINTQEDWERVLSAAAQLQEFVPEGAGETTGERGIRTPETLRSTRFPSERIRPLCHLSESGRGVPGRGTASALV